MTKTLSFIQNLDQMISELCLHRAQDLALLTLEGRLLELRDHLALAKPPKISASLARRTLGVFPGHLCKALALAQLVQNLLSFLVILHENMGCMNLFYHGWIEDREG